MQQTFVSERKHGADKTPIAWPNTRAARKVALVYQDVPTQQWARQAKDQLSELAGDEAVEATEWNVNDLVQVKVFSEGVAALGQADVIVISLHEADRLPPPFYLWVNLWLQVRSGRAGTLVALITRSGETMGQANETRRYLYAVASQGGLELSVEEFDQPTGPIHVLRDDKPRWAKAA